ncbi:hypothetical protein [Streptomyces sp. NPDC056682]|uniref:hypothetical protein n=1 Tax=Streptomyces sp. NPDC056682 TaxID=3345909 RepID=UPI003695BE8A
MSLSVDVFVVGTDGELQILDVPEGASDLAGFERWRTTVWGSDTVGSLGARFFPQLSSDDLKVEPSEVSAFLQECALLRKHLEDIATRTVRPRTLEEHRHALSRRLANIENAANRAQSIGGGVLIW